MIGRRAVLGAALVIALSACAQVDAGVTSKVAKLQSEYAKEQGVTSVTLTASLKNESFTTIWWGKATLADGLSPDDQARLLVRLFDLAGSLGLPTGQFDWLAFTLPGKTQVTVHRPLDQAWATDLVTTLAKAPGATAGLDDRTLTLNVTVAAPDLVSFVDAATPILTLAQPMSFGLSAGAQYGTFPAESSLATDHHLSDQELSVLPLFKAWLVAHRTTEYHVMLSDSEKGAVTLRTAADETDAVKAFATAVSALGIRSSYLAYLGGAQQPYLSIPRG